MLVKNYNGQSSSYDSAFLLSQVDGVRVINKIDTFSNYSTIKHIPGKSEWYAYDKSLFYYDYKPLKYSEQELNLLTNILYRESGIDSTNIDHEINQYFVVICAIYTINSFNKFNSITELINSGTTFTRPLNGHLNKDKVNGWNKCKEICKNVLECKIPSYIPYLPTGTIAYWGSEIDTNEKQKKHLESNYICVASTSLNVHYYCHLKYISNVELNYLIHNDLLCNPIKKNISNGKLC
jgi:hypothetical protein